jgi:hypothetical protein
MKNACVSWKSLVVAWLMVGAVAAIFAQLDGPGVCNYRDGAVLNVGGWPCGSPPWIQAPSPQPGRAPLGSGS